MDIQEIEDFPESTESKNFHNKSNYSSNEPYIEPGRTYHSRQSARECRQRKKALTAIEYLIA
ncbi:hypothetical protein MXB_1072 [Myxobolus squamalis]|nr:hypothetical protein MXB_1072 [Myxobolus squamalis]